MNRGFQNILGALRAAISSIDSQPEDLLSTAGAANEYEASVGAGDANESSYFESYKRVKKPVIASTLASSTGAQNIGANGTTPIFLSGLLVQVALAGTLTISGFTDPTGAAVSKVFPVGSVGQLIPLGVDLQMDSGCTMTLSVAADSSGNTGNAAGNVLVLWRNQ